MQLSFPSFSFHVFGVPSHPGAKPALNTQTDRRRQPHKTYLPTVPSAGDGAGLSSETPSWPGLGGGRPSWPVLGDGGADQDWEMAELTRIGKRRSGPGLGDSEPGEGEAGHSFEMMERSRPGL